MCEMWQLIQFKIRGGTINYSGPLIKLSRPPLPYYLYDKRSKVNQKRDNATNYCHYDYRVHNNSQNINLNYLNKNESNKCLPSLLLDRFLNFYVIIKIIFFFIFLSSIYKKFIDDINKL